MGARGKASSRIVVWLLAVSLFAGIGGLFAAPAAAQGCSGAPGTGDWNIPVGTNEVCRNIIVVMDGNLNIQGSLLVENGGIKFVEDTSHQYGISLTNGGDLTLRNSTVWTETTQIDPYLKLTVSVSGAGSTLTLNNSVLAFPGTFDTSANAAVTLENGSVITRTAADVAAIFSTAGDESNDAPVMTFDSSTVRMFASRVEDLYENSSIAAPDPRMSIRLTGTTAFTAVDTYLGIDVTDAVNKHNTLSLAGTANAYLYGVTIDASQQPSRQDLWQPAIETAAGTEADVYRWADVRVVDHNGVPVQGANIDAFFAGAESGLATFRDNGGATSPPLWITTYLGGPAWDVTDPSGSVRMPLVSDWITSTTQPNSRFVGAFTLDARATINTVTYTGSSSLTFPAYPAMDVGDAAGSATITMTLLSQNLPDLTPMPPTFNPATPKQLETVAITAPIHNQGLGGAGNILVQVFDGVSLLLQTRIRFIPAGGTQSVSATLVNASAGPHVIRVWVDPNNEIIEGPGILAEANNLKGYSLYVTPFGPDLQTSVSFYPDPAYLNNPVSLNASVTNVGDANTSTAVLVNFYVQATPPVSGDTPVGSATIPFIEAGSVGAASVNWTPTDTVTYRVYAWADPYNAIPEPPPYNETDNVGFADLSVTPSPDLVTSPQDITLTDPFPRIGQDITLEAVVRNNGQADAGPFDVQYSVDGVPITPIQSSPGLAAGQKWIVPTVTVPTGFATCGIHTVGINVDIYNTVREGALYERNNVATASVQAFPDTFYTWSTGTIDADQSLSRSLEISGPVTIDGARLSLVQDQGACGRYYVKVLGPAGSLTLRNGATLGSNWPLVVFVAPGGTLTATGSTLALDNQGKGVLRSTGTLTLRDTTIAGDVVARGTAADLRNDTFRGSLLHIDTAGTSRVWDPTFSGVQTIELASDTAGTDFDVRNATFNAALTSQLVFSGTQTVQFTNVSFAKAGDWWTGMLTQSAHITRYWWLDLMAVDGTGTLIPSANPTVIGLERFNPATPGWQPAPSCATPETCYFNTNTTWPVGTRAGMLLYRAAAEDRYGDQDPVVQATYRATGAAFVESTWRPPYPDRYTSALVTAVTTVELRFTDLTPNFHITSIQFVGDNGVNVPEQPIGRQMSIVATVANDGKIIARGVTVYCYSDDVDKNGDGIMDNSQDFYVSSGIWIPDTDGPKDIPPAGQGDATFTCRWTPPGTFEGDRTISVVADPLHVKSETNELDNIRTQRLTVFTWPDLHLANDPVSGTTPPTLIVGNAATLHVEVSNKGTTTATNAVLGLYPDANPASTPLDSATFTLAAGAATTIDLVWTPPAAGTQTIWIRATSAGAPIPPSDYRNYDFDATDNLRSKDYIVQTQPDLMVERDGAAPSPYRLQPFVLNIYVNNTGQTGATNIYISVRDQTDGAPGPEVGHRFVPLVQPGSLELNVSVPLGIEQIGSRQLNVTVDANNSVHETNELNNWVLISVDIQAPVGNIFLDLPAADTSFQPGQTITVSGRVTSQTTGPIGGVNVTAQLLDSANLVVRSKWALSASGSGTFLFGLDTTGLADSTYTVRVAAQDAPSIQPVTVSVKVAKAVGFLDVQFIGLPVWIWLIIILIAALAIGGGTVYVKFVGLGKLVECGECGAFIPEDSAKCPKCGVEFEKDMAKCSNCQAWIPVGVKQCPECGVEFATGEVEMADYEAQMRKQYEDVRRKFREEAQRDLGKSLTDREFDDWWRAQPTFVTFEDWLREEEDMRRMGSRPCPTCNTLNSVTATVCHKCGTLLKEEVRKPAARPAARPAAAPAAGRPEGAPPAGAPAEAIPKKVVKKPVVGAPVVQKKIIKRPLEGEEKKEGEGGEGSGGGDEGEQI